MGGNENDPCMAASQPSKPHLKAEFPMVGSLILNEPTTTEANGEIAKTIAGTRTNHAGQLGLSSRRGLESRNLACRFLCIAEVSQRHRSRMVNWIIEAPMTICELVSM